MNRKLAAIMVADYVGSTAAMEANEELAVTHISSCLDTVGEIATEHGGRIFNTAGDALLVEFPSPVNAIRAAMNARYSLESCSETSKNEMRFGLHLADVLEIGNDLRGDGVNLAARIQSDAQPGEIEISESLFNHVRKQSPCGFNDLGEKAFKGIAEPVRIFRVTTTVDRHRYHHSPTKTTNTVEPHPDSVAVIPFQTASSADEDQIFLADGLTEDLTMELSRLKSLFVSSRSATETLQSNDPIEIGNALGVRFILSGSVRKLGSRIRFNVALSETQKGEIIWSDRIQRPFDEVLDIMDEITTKVAVTVSGRIQQAALASAKLKRPENMSAYEYYMRGVEQHRMVSIDDKYAIQAIHWFDQAIDADPEFGRPYSMKVCSMSSLPDFDINEVEPLLSKAIELDPTDPEAHRIMGIVQIMLHGDYQTSRYHHERAISLAPNNAYIIGRCAAFYNFAGEPDKALSFLDKAEQLDPFLPVWIVEERVASLYSKQQYVDMITVSNTLPFQTRRTRLYQAAAFSALGDAEKAQTQIKEALNMDSSLSTQYVIKQELYQDKGVLNTLINRLTEMGLPS